jgi:selenocysteine lyase/cysteine desulfurase
LQRVAVATIQQRVRELASRLREGLGTLPDFLQQLPGESGIVSARVLQGECGSIVAALWAARIDAACLGAHYLPLLLRPSETVLRFSVHAVSDESDVDRALEAVARLCRSGDAQPG